jgi:hypothetical protein
VTNTSTDKVKKCNVNESTISTPATCLEMDTGNVLGKIQKFLKSDILFFFYCLLSGLFRNGSDWEKSGDWGWGRGGNLNFVSGGGDTTTIMGST